VVGTLYEYRSSWKRFFPQPINEADKLNGIQFRGLAVFGAPTSRQFFQGSTDPADRKWDHWETYGDRITSAADAANANRLDSWSGVKLKITLVKSNNKWSYVPGDVRWISDASFDPDAVAAEKRSCRAAVSAAPFAANTDGRGTGK
jgi:hypothetical protein